MSALPAEPRGGDARLRVGLVGAGPWATLAHAPLLAAGPRTTLTAVWARRPEAAARLAERHGAAVAGTPAQLFASCDAVAFAVPPAVQAELAVEAAAAGCALLLDKPIAADLAGAERLAAAVDRAGVASLVLLSWRYAAEVRRFLAAADGFEVAGAEARFLSGALLGGPFATPWRLDRGPLLDLGPHVVDLLDAAVGPVEEVHADGDRLGLVALQLRHRSGAVSAAVLSGSLPVDPPRAGVELYGPQGVLEVDCQAAVGVEAFATVADELATAVAAGGHRLDVHRGLHLQRLIDGAERQLLAAEPPRP